jgi:hypothetical protein
LMLRPEEPPDPFIEVVSRLTSHDYIISSKPSPRCFAREEK